MQPPLERQLALLGYELVHLETAREGKDELLRLYIDHLDAETSRRTVTLDDCTRAHEGLLLWMDVEFPDLREKLGVEVSSPGMERPLVKADHFRRFAGRLCRVQTAAPINGQKRFKGWIGPVVEGEHHPRGRRCAQNHSPRSNPEGAIGTLRRGKNTAAQASGRPFD